MINSPLVSIVIPVYNGSNYLREAIESALSQTYHNVEIIVVNDGSNDNGETEKIATSYGDRIRYFYKNNGGVSSALNLGIQMMKGEYFSWLSHDDAYRPDKINNQIKYADCDTVVMCGRNLIDKNSVLLGDAREKFRFQKECLIDGDDAVIALLKQGCFNGCSLLIPKTAFEQIGYFDESLHYCQDLLMWLRIFLEGYKLKFIPQKDVLSRVHEAQLTNTKSDLFHKDCMYLSELVIGSICDKSTCDKNLLYYFCKYNAVYNNSDVVNKSVAVGKENNILTAYDIFKIRSFQVYGSIRPMIRKIYYKVFKKMNSR